MNYRFSNYTFIFFCFLILSNESLAQRTDTTGIDNVVIKGNRIDSQFSQSTRDIQILSAKEIEKLPVNSLNELLAYVGGVDVRQRGPFGAQADVSMDGGTFEETLILLNGISLINSQTAHNALNLPIPLSSIDHIEVLRGSAARIYGINSLTGAINIVTKQSAKSSVEATIFGGSSFQQKDPREGKGIYVGGGAQVTGNFGTEKQTQLISVGKTNYNGQRYNSNEDGIQAFYNGRFRINDRNSLQLVGGYSKNQFGANGFYAAPGDSNSYEYVTTALASISSEHKLGRFTFSPRISNRYDEDEYLYIKNKPTIGHSMHYTNALMGELNGSVKTTIGTFGLGWGARFETINSSNIGRHDRVNHGVYVEYKGVFWNKLLANAGSYVNYNTSYGWQIYPGIDVAYLFRPNWKLAASAGSGQRIPSFTDLYLQQLPGNIGNPNLRPENAWTYDLNLRYNKNKLTAQIGCFYRSINDFIDWVRETPILPYSPLNYGKINIHGVYTRIQQHFVFGEHQSFSYFVKYNYLLPDIQKSDKQSKYVLESLKHQLIVGINYKIKDFYLQISNRIIQRELNKAYDLLDVRLNYQIKQFDVYADVTNILGTEYREVGAVPMPTRWFQLGLRYRWSN